VIVDAGRPVRPAPSVGGVLDVPVRVLDPDLALPAYARAGDAGADLLAREPVVLAAAGGRALVPTGIALALPVGYAGFVQPRSGLALRHGVTCLNTPIGVTCRICHRTECTARSAPPIGRPILPDDIRRTTAPFGFSDT